MDEFLDKKTYVRQAEAVVSKLKKDRKDNIGVSSSQLRNILSLINELYNAVLYNKSEKLNDDIQSHAQYIKMKIAYAVGRDNRDGYVRDFVEQSKIMEYIEMIGDSRDRLMTVCHYMESLVAYHKFMGGKD